MEYAIAFAVVVGGTFLGLWIAGKLFPGDRWAHLRNKKGRK